MRKRCHRRHVLPLPPRGLRPKLDAGQVRDLAIAHHTHVDLVAHGKGTVDLLWEMAAAALGWSRCAQRLGLGEPEMAAELQLIANVLKRWERTGRVAYTGPELQQARAGLEVVDQLARVVDHPTALESVDWAEDEVNRRRDAWALARSGSTANVQKHSTQASMQTEARAA
jgi:hypothetical protein